MTRATVTVGTIFGAATAAVAVLGIPLVGLWRQTVKDAEADAGWRARIEARLDRIGMIEVRLDKIEDRMSAYETYPPKVAK